MGNIGPNPNPFPFQPQPQQVGGGEGLYGAPLSTSGAGEEFVQIPVYLENGEVMLAPFFGYDIFIQPQEVGLLLKNLLQLPKEITELLALLATADGVDPQQLLKTLLADNPKISLEELQKLLQDHLKNGETKLLKLLQSAQTAKTGASMNIGELISTLSQVSTKAATSPTQALNTTLALYMPFFPLQPPQRFHMDFEQPASDGEGGAKAEDYQLVVYIDTISLGQFKIIIGLAHGTQLTVIIEHGPQAAHVLPAIEQQVRAGTRQENVPPPNLVFTQREAPPQAAQASPASASGDGQSPAKPSVGIHPVGGVSVVAIHAAYLLTRVIIELDTRNAVNANRARKSVE